MQRLNRYFFWMGVKSKLKKIPVFSTIVRGVKWRVIRPIYTCFWSASKNIEYALKEKGVMSFSPNDKKIEKLKNIKKGEDAFIIGNGPSLSASDLDKIHDLGIYCFASNRIGLIFEKTRWRPNCYTALDRQIYRNNDPTIPNILSENLDLYVFGKQVFDGLDKEAQEKMNVAYTALKPNSYYQKIDEFSTDPKKVSINGFTVTYIAMQLAYYMGFKNVYLLGVDCNYSKRIKSNGVVECVSDKPTYFAKEYDSKNSNVGYVDGMIESYQTAQKISKESNGAFNIYNATRGGELDVFERVQFDELMDVLKERKK